MERVMNATAKQIFNEGGTVILCPSRRDPEDRAWGIPVNNRKGISFDSYYLTMMQDLSNLENGYAIYCYVER